MVEKADESEPPSSDDEKEKKKKKKRKKEAQEAAEEGAHPQPDNRRGLTKDGRGEGS